MVINVAPLHKSEYKGQNRNLLSFNHKEMLLIGIIPPEELPESPIKTVLLILYLIVWYGFYAPLFIAQILAAYHFWGNMDIIAYTVEPLLGIAMIQLEGIYARLYSSSIHTLLDFLESNVNSKVEEMDLNENHIQILEKAKVKVRCLSIIMIVIIAVMAICWIIFPFTRNNLREHNSGKLNMTTVQYDVRWLDFSYVIWAPFDLTLSPYYEITYVCQIIVLITTAACWNSMETTIMTLIIYTAAHLKVLETFLSEMKTVLLPDSVNGMAVMKSNNIHVSDNVPFSTHGSVKHFGTVELNQECLSMDRLENNGFKNEKQKLRDFIVNFVNYHEAVNAFVQKVNNIFGPILLMSFIIRQILVCLQLFQIAVTGVDDTFVTNLISCVAVMTPHFIFCWYGNEVIENSQLLRQAAFESSLSQHSREFKHFILMLMKNTQKPLQFSALGFYTLSLEGFAKTVNGAYAYFNILKNIHGHQ